MPVDDSVVLELRPKLVWRWLSPIVAVGSLVHLWGTWTTLQFWLIVGASALLAVGAQRSYIRVEDRAIFRRGIARWSEPLLLDHLAEISLQRRWGRGDNPHLELRLRSDDGVSFSFEPRWWSHADRLVRMAAAAALEDSPNGTDRRVWKVDLNAKTKERLAEYL